MMTTSILFKKEKIEPYNKVYDLNNDGFCIFHNVLNKEEINKLKKKCYEKKYKIVQDYLLNNHKLKNVIHSVTNIDYKFQDYIWIIQKSSVHTCHRDNNGDFFNKNQKYP